MIMKKIQYVAPSCKVLALDSEELMAATSVMNAESNTINVTLSDNEYDGSFSSKYDIWEDE